MITWPHEQALGYSGKKKSLLKGRIFQQNISVSIYLYRFIKFISLRNKSQTNLNHNLFNPTCVYTSVLALKLIRVLYVFNFYFVIF